MLEGRSWKKGIGRANETWQDLAGVAAEFHKQSYHRS
jgi:hypothetical protein